MVHVIFWNLSFLDRCLPTKVYELYGTQTAELLPKRECMTVIGMDYFSLFFSLKNEAMQLIKKKEITLQLKQKNLNVPYSLNYGRRV